MSRSSLIACLALALLSGGLGAQTSETPSPPAPSGAEPPSSEAAASPGRAAEADLLRSTLGLDIQTSTFYELVEWLRSLGLPDSGSIAELRSRLYDYYDLAPPIQEKRKGRTILIQRAARAEYSEPPESGGAIIRLEGGVSLTITEENGDTQTVSAREIVYDRERNAVSARGNVVYRRESKSKVEECQGESLSADLDDWSGVFLDGRMRQEGAEIGQGERGLVFSADTLVKRSRDVLVFEHGIISACDEESPHYSIRAGRMWFLGGNDWAIANAVVSLGEVPILWIPFFYYPADEIVFHPVLGYRSREGRFVQTTTYLIGQKAASEEKTGLLRLSQESGPTELHGLFLRRVASAEKAKDDSTLKLEADVYSGLGSFLGLEGSFDKLGPFSGVDFSGGLGLSRSLFSQGTYYSPYDDSGDWASVWNTSYFMGMEFPLRYAFDLSGSLKRGSLTASLSFPLFSDPYFEQDFSDRSEDMDWLSLSSSDEDSSSTSKRSSFTQKLSLSFAPDVSALSPWLSSFRISSLDTSLYWLSKTDYTVKGSESTALYSVDPARQFFYPQLLKPIDLDLSLKGSLFSYPGKAGKAGPDAGPTETPGGADAGPALREPWTAEEEGASDSEEDDNPTTGTAQELFRLPALAASVAASKQAKPLEMGVDWSLTPSVFWEDRFLTEAWEGAEDIDEELLYSLLSYSLSGSVTASAKLYGDILSANLGLTYTDQDQFRSVNEDETYAARKTAYELADAQYEKRALSSSLKLSSKPFSGHWLLSPTSFTYSLVSKLYEHSYDSLVDSVPIYDEILLGWNDDSITTHNAGVSLGFKTGSWTQTLGLTMSLPPTDESYTAKLGLAGGLFGYTSSFSFQEKAVKSSGTYSLDPFSATLKAATPFGLSLSDSLVYDPDEEYFVSNTANLTWGWFTMALTSKRSKSYSLEPGTGWISSGDEAFRPYQLSASLKGSLKGKEGGWALPVLTLNTAYTQSLLRFSESTLSFGLDFSLKLGQGFALSFSSLSQNSSAWRYWPEFFPALSELGDPEDYRRSLLEDIVESLSFWDADARVNGLFKLKKLSFKLTQDLHDWDLAITASVAPLLDTDLEAYVLDPEFSFTLTWRDIPDIESAISYDRDDGWTM